MNAVLAVWNDCAPAARDDFERWYVQEHLIERLSVPGFLSGHRYEAQDADRRYFTWYQTSSADVLASAAYRERLDNPTPWTRRIMPSFTHAVRTVCDIGERHGDVEGAHVVTLRRGAAEDSIAPAFAQAAEAKGLTRAQLWTASPNQSPSTAEARIRPSADELIQDALVAEFGRLDDASRFASGLRRAARPGTSLGIYSHLCSLHGPRGARP